ncbi:MAG: glycine cleavage system protein H [Omnitrophica WOR_2 bacterium GWA2_37_7]|nr:MAG: glycine cleavage system protein H [Omnitrophica WOR_2 bacterium GWA2_37_7]OGX52770.1 MAG: glycine cleavage system protein H [Omnitrophica WOR_2 bacterium RIFOXYA12_FULL_38_10]OGX59373.1 MAG: glycine cleavage system protein H [Omnitrophica WOR_2 bacterium RIFOXYC2_FULL_38_12]
MEIVEHLMYTKDHEWVLVEDDIATIGITDYAQSSLGDITFIELPSVGDEAEQFGEIVSVESVKAASDVFSPISGRVVEINTELETDPALINRSPYEKGWLAKIEIADKEELSNLMTAEEYENFLDSVG